MHRTKSPRRSFRNALPLLALLALLVGCSSPTTGPIDLGEPVLAVAHIAAGEDGGVSVFTSTGFTSEMTRSRLFRVVDESMAYSALIGPSGDFFVSHFNAGTISIVDAEEATAGTGPGSTTMAPSRSFTSPDMSVPTAMAFDARGDLWVIDVRNSDPNSFGANRVVRFADPETIVDGASVPAATILDLAEQPAGYMGHRLVYTIYMDHLDRLWYTDNLSWSIGRLDDLAGRGAHEMDVVPDMQIITWDPSDAGSTASIVNPTDISLSLAGDLYVGSNNGDHVYRFDDATSLSGPHIDLAPSARLDVGIAKPRFIEIDHENALWILSNTDYKLVRVEGHESGAGIVSLTPNRELTWGSTGAVYGGGLQFTNAVR